MILRHFARVQSIKTFLIKIGKVCIGFLLFWLASYKVFKRNRRTDERIFYAAYILRRISSLGFIQTNAESVKSAKQDGIL